MDAPSAATENDGSFPGGRDDAIVSAATLLPDGPRLSVPEISLAAAIFKDAIRCL